MNKNINQNLTNAELVQLIKLAKNGNKQARDKILLANQGLIYFVLKSKPYPKSLKEDLVAEANWGLLKAIDKFDPSLGVKFSSYAWYWIEYGLQKASIDFGSAVKPVRVKKSTTTSGNSEEEIEKVAEKAVNEYKKPTNYKTGHLFPIMTNLEDEPELINAESNPFNLIAILKSKKIINDLLAELTLKERIIICNEFELDSRFKETQGQVCEYLKMKPSSHRKSKLKILQKLKLELSRRGINSFNFY